MHKISHENFIITGATGFIGSALVKKILEHTDGTIAVLVNPESKHKNRLPKHQNLLHIPYDIQSGNGLSACKFPNIPFNTFFHLGWIGVQNTYRNHPSQSLNISRSLETLALAKELGCKKWVGTGSQAEYGPLNRKISETDPTYPTTLYGASKLSTCMLTEMYGRQLEIQTAWVRIFSTYGPGNNVGWLLTDVAESILGGVSPQLTLGEQLWDYLYVDDAAEALLQIAISDTLHNSVYNLGSGTSRTIRSIVELVRDLIDPEFPLHFGEVPYRPDQVMHLEADITRLVKDTNWVPKTELNVGIQRVINSMLSLKQR